MSEKSSKTVLLCEEGVKTFAGHWAPYNQAIADGLCASGIACQIAGHVDADQSVRKTLDFQPVFHYSRWDGTYEHQSWIARKFLILLHNWRVYRDMSAFLKRSGPYDCIFCGNILVYHSLAWYWLSRRFLGKKFHNLVLMLIQPAGKLEHATGQYVFPKRSVLLRWSLQHTIDRSRGRVRLAVETPEAQIEFGQLVKRPIERLHHPVDFPKSWNPKPLAKNKIRRYVCPGFARHEKGSDVLQDAIRIGQEQLLALNIKFTFQWKADGGFRRKEGNIEGRDKTLEANGLVQYEESVLSGMDYWDFLANSDLLVLPYRCDPYTTRLSRVTIEAMQVGRPIIYPKGSWLEFAVNESGVGVGFDDGSPKSLLGAIIEATSNLDALKVAAHAKASQARIRYSSKSFADELISTFQ
jgi:glycosyltransferase involved in cell wall biosynthesis